ncbi:MAG TPA: hypothetical protein VJK02_10185, partial [Anaerolineales bacterium]|nr:hypothetical protein [Anaerolineales bacterium]
MGESATARRARAIAREVVGRVESLPLPNTPAVRSIRREYSRALRREEAELILAVAKEVLQVYGYR